MKMKIIITLLLIFTGSVAMAHDGAVSADGCHTQGDNFHCHSAGKAEAINETDSINGTSLRKERGKGFSLETFGGFGLLPLDLTEIEADYSLEEDGSFTESYGLYLEYHIDETHSVGIDYYNFKKATDLDLIYSRRTREGTGVKSLRAILIHKVVGPTYRYYFPFGLYLGISYFIIDSEVATESTYIDELDLSVPSASATEQNGQFSASIGYKHVFKSGFTLGSRFVVIPTIMEGTESDVRSLGFTMGYDFR